MSGLFTDLNNQRVARGQRPLPQNVLKRIVDTGVGANSTVNGLNDVDDAAIKNALVSAGELYDIAAKGRDYYERLSAYVDTGSRPDQSHIDVQWNKMFPVEDEAPAARQQGPAPGYTFLSRAGRE